MVLDEPLPALPVDALNIALVLALGLFVGLEREGHKQQESAYAFGGVRTFPLLGLVSYALSLISPGALVPWTLGFAVVGGFMLLSYRKSLSGEPPAGLTSEISALAIYVVGGLVQHRFYWIATTLAVLCVLLLELKKGLEGLTKYVASREVATFAKFLMLAVVVLPIVPNRDMTRFRINPFRTWAVVVAVSGISFASYASQRLLKARGGVLLSAVLGGAYSSTVTTVVLARQAKESARPNLYAGSILCASGVMYARLVLLLAIFNGTLAARLAVPFVGLGSLGVLAGWSVSRRGDPGGRTTAAPHDRRNPLEMGAALLFALVFSGVLVVTQLVREHFGQPGLFGMAALMGLTDVDPFILGLAQSDAEPSLSVLASAIVIATASNQVMKAVYAYAFADSRTGRRAAMLLLTSAALGLAPLFWVMRSG